MLLIRVLRQSILPSMISIFYAYLYSLYTSPACNSTFKRSLKITILNLLIIQTIIITLLEKYKEKQKIPTSEEYKWSVLVVKMFLINFFFGICHRFLHTKLLYPIHRQHHQYVHTEAIAAFDVSIPEFLFSYMIPPLFTELISLYIFKKMYVNIDLIHVYILLFQSFHIHVEKPMWCDILRFYPFYSNKFHIKHHRTLSSNYCAPFFGIF